MQGPDLSPDPSAEIAATWGRFRDVVGDQVSILEEAVAGVLAGNLTAGLRARAEAEAHKLSGSLGTLGMSHGSEVARDLEARFATFGALTAAQHAVELSEAVVALRDAVETGPDLHAPSAAAPPDGRPRVLVVGTDVAVGNLDEEAARRRLRLQSVATVAEARELGGDPPDVVLLDISNGDGSDDAFEMLRELRNLSPPVPVLVTTRAGVFTDRVEAARLGAHGFINQPVAAEELFEAVTDALDRTRRGEATVLSVDDDPATLAALTVLLKPLAGRVVGLSEPLRFWEVLEETSPDLVVLDVEMPEVSGIELCQVLRADARWNHVPVLFLSARTDPATVQALFSAGADDYVPKPIVGPELATRISNRLERTKLLRQIAETDTLTGIPNQRTASRAATRCIRSAERFAQPLAVAAVEVDGLKSINDRHGYAAGDEVLAWIGKLLLSRFSGEDAVGRRGGGQLFVAMHGMTRGDGVHRMAEVLEELRQHRFTDGLGASWTASFSAGVAQYPDDGGDLDALFRSTDKALRVAKDLGHDRVVPVTGGPDDAGGPDRAGTVQVVLVEDDKALADLLLHSLATRGYSTRWFDDGHDALSALEGPVPDVRARVVLLDWGLPSIDGLRVLRRMADTGVLNRTRVIMLTARDAEGEVLQALDVGAFDHVAKPFSVPVLVKKVHRAMEW